MAGYPTDNTIVPNDSLARVNGSGQKTGPSLLLRVMSGDVVDVAITISWLADLKEIHNFLPDRLYKKKNFDRVEWDSVSLFENINVYLLISFSKNILPSKLDNNG